MTQTLNRPVLTESVILTLICLLDTAHTLTVVRLGIAKEANPIVAWSLAHSDWAFITFKLGSSIAVVSALEHIRCRVDKFVRFMLRCGIAGYIGIYVFGSIALLLAHR